MIIMNYDYVMGNNMEKYLDICTDSHLLHMIVQVYYSQKYQLKDLHVATFRACC